MAECNNYTGLQINPTPSSIGNQYAGVSTDEKPANAPTYSVYLELDTGKFYYYDGTEWKEIPCCGGGGSDEPSLDPFRICFSDMGLINSVLLNSTTVGDMVDNGFFVRVPGTQCVELVSNPPVPFPSEISFGYVDVTFNVRTEFDGEILALATSENPTVGPFPTGDGISYFIEGNVK